jgi:hypothetical protein
VWIFENALCVRIEDDILDGYEVLTKEALRYLKEPTM